MPLPKSRGGKIRAPKLIAGGSTEPSMGNRAAPQSLTDQAYARIRHDIITCALKPGQEIAEIDLAARFEMSKTPVREALVRLQLEGLVKAFPRRGYQIAPIRVSDVNEIFDLRIILEAAAIDLAIAHATDDDLERLSALAGAAVDGQYMDNPIRAHHLNNEFHSTIAQMSRNERLHRTVLQTLQELERFFYLEAQASDRYPPDHVGHLAIVDVMRRRDAASARAAMVEHIQSTRSVLLYSLISGSGDRVIRLE